MAALTSRFRTEPHLQVHSRSLSVSSLLMLPQHEHIFDDGSKRPIFKMFFPLHFALYSNMSTNILHPESKIDLFNPDLADAPFGKNLPLSSCFGLQVDDMPFIFKSSNAMLSWLLISSVESLCKKSFRWLATVSCMIANFFFVRFPLYLEYLRCTYFNFDNDWFNNFGLFISKPSEVTSNDFIPKSIPIVVFSLIFFCLGSLFIVSTNTLTKYFPVGVLLIVACFAVPLNFRCRTISIPFFLNFGMINLLFSKSIITFCGILKDFLAVFFLKLGKLPCPLKNLVKALSKCVIDCCKDCELISDNHSHSFFKSGSCLIKSKQLKFTLLPAYAICLHSNAKLYTKRHEPICLFISSACVVVGYIRYLYAFNTVQI